MRDKAQADDLVQEAWLVVLRRGVDDIEKPRPWLAGVLRNLAFRAGRSQRRRSHYEENAPPADADARRAPDDRAALEEAKRHVLFALGALEPSYREVVHLRYFENLNSTQIAQRLGLSPSAVRTRLQRALHAMRTQLDATWSGDARTWSVGLAALASGWTPRVTRKPWLVTNGPRLGAAAAVLVAAVAWWAALSSRATPAPASVTTSATTPVASHAARAVALPMHRSGPDATPATTRRLLAAVTVESRGGLEGRVRVTLRSEPSGTELERDVAFNKTSILDLTSLTERGWPTAVWVEARHPSDQSLKRFVIPTQRATTLLPIGLVLRASAPGTTSRPGATSPAVSASDRPALQLRSRQAQPTSPRASIVRRGATAKNSAPRTSSTAPGMGPVGIPTLRRSVAQPMTAPRAPAPWIEPDTGMRPSTRIVDPRKQFVPDPFGSHAPDPEFPGSVFPGSSYPDSSSPGSSYPGGGQLSQPGGGIVLAGLPTSGPGSVVVRIETQRDDRSFWIGDEFGPMFQLPDDWRRGDPVAVDGLWPGRYRIYEVGRDLAWRPRAQIDVSAYERSAIVLRDDRAHDSRSALGPQMPLDSIGVWLSALAQHVR